MVVEYWHSKKFEADTKSNSVGIHQNLVPDMFRTSTRILFFLYVSKDFLGKDVHVLSTSVVESLGDIPNCYVAESANDFKSTHRLG